MNLDEYEMKWLSAYMEDSGSDFEYALKNYKEKSRFWDGLSKSEVSYELADEEIYMMVPTNSVDWVKSNFDYESYESKLNVSETSYGVLETY